MIFDQFSPMPDDPPLDPRFRQHSYYRTEMGAQPIGPANPSAVDWHNNRGPLQDMQRQWADDEASVAANMGARMRMAGQGNPHMGNPAPPVQRRHPTTMWERFQGQGNIIPPEQAPSPQRPSGAGYDLQGHAYNAYPERTFYGVGGQIPGGHDPWAPTDGGFNPLDRMSNAQKNALMGYSGGAQPGGAALQGGGWAPFEGGQLPEAVVTAERPDLDFRQGYRQPDVGMPGAGDLRQLNMAAQAMEGGGQSGGGGKGAGRNALGALGALSPILMMALAGMMKGRNRGGGGGQPNYRGQQNVLGQGFAY